MTLAHKSFGAYDAHFLTWKKNKLGVDGELSEGTRNENVIMGTMSPLMDKHVIIEF